MLLTKTTELGIQCLLYLCKKPVGYRLVPAEVAKQLGESPTYLSKVLRHMAKAGLLSSQRGKSGGFTLEMKPAEITLLDIVEATQGTIPGNYCEEVKRRDLNNTCGYHQAMVELQDGTREVLGRWSLARILKGKPPRSGAAPLCKLGALMSKSGP